MNSDDDLPEVPSGSLRTLLHDKDLLARIIVAVDRPHPQLVAVAGVCDPARVIPLSGETMTIGRSVGSEIELDDNGVSRRHAKLRISDDMRVFVSDLGSSNGSMVNGARITSETPLNEGDLLQVGDVVFLLFYTGDAKQKCADDALDDTGSVPRHELIEQLEADCSSARTLDDAPSVALVSVLCRYESDATLASMAALETAMLQHIVRAVGRSLQDDHASIGRYRHDVLAILLPEVSESEFQRFERWVRELQNLPQIASSARVAFGASRWRPGLTSQHMLDEADLALRRDLAR